MNQKQHIPQNILATIGHTPMVQMTNLFPEYNVNIYAKLEAFNPGGSIKDRTAMNILTDAIHHREVQKGTTIIESSSGNMAVGLAQACLRFGLKLIVVVDPLVNQHTLKILKTYGAQVDMVEVPAENGGYLNARLQRVEELLEQVEDSFWPNQYANHANPGAHRQTMAEIVGSLDGEVDYLFSATSTCGTIMGCANYIRELGLDTKIIGVDAVGSAIFNDVPAERLIPGHGAGRASQLLDKSFVHEVVHISDRECVLGCRQLLQREAILAGGSSGAVVMALQKLLPHIPKGSNCALILCDRGERYLDTIYSDDWVNQHLGSLEVDAEPENTLYY